MTKTREQIIAEFENEERETKKAKKDLLELVEELEKESPEIVEQLCDELVPKGWKPSKAH